MMEFIVLAVVFVVAVCCYLVGKSVGRSLAREAAMSPEYRLVRDKAKRKAARARKARRLNRKRK